MLSIARLVLSCKYFSVSQNFNNLNRISITFQARLLQSSPHNFFRCGPGGPGAKDFSTMQRATFYEQGFLLGA